MLDHTPKSGFVDVPASTIESQGQSNAVAGNNSSPEGWRPMRAPVVEDKKVMDEVDRMLASWSDDDEDAEMDQESDDASNSSNDSDSKHFEFLTWR